MTEDAHPLHGGFVGRQRELQALRVALAKACAGSDSLWLLVGEAGIGKTRVADELTRDARQLGLRLCGARGIARWLRFDEAANSIAAVSAALGGCGGVNP